MFRMCILLKQAYKDVDKSCTVLTGLIGYCTTITFTMCSQLILMFCPFSDLNHSNQFVIGLALCSLGK